MANTFIPKRSTVAGKVPLPSDLQIGELAVNLTDRKIYTKDANSAVVQLNDAAGVGSFNTRTGAVTLQGSDVTGALGWSPVQNGTGTGQQAGNTVKIGWGGVGNENLLLQIDNSDKGANWPINITGNSAKTSRWEKQVLGANWIDTGAGDNATSTQTNINVRSWFGIGFGPSVSGQTVPYDQNAIWMNVREGTMTTRGLMYVNSGQTVVYTRSNSVNAPLRVSGYIEWSTDIGAVGTNYFTSDKRLKDNITPTSEDALGKICALDFVDFNYKEGTGYDTAVRYKSGFIAQDLEAQESTWVNRIGEGEGERLSPNPATLLPYAMHAIKQLKGQNDQLRAELDDLRSKVDQLLARAA